MQNNRFTPVTTNELQTAIESYFKDNSHEITIATLDDFFINRMQNITLEDKDIVEHLNGTYRDLVVLFNRFEKILKKETTVIYSDFSTVMDFSIKNGICLNAGENNKVSRMVKKICEDEGIKYGNLFSKYKVVYPVEIIKQVLHLHYKKVA